MSRLVLRRVQILLCLGCVHLLQYVPALAQSKTLDTASLDRNGYVSIAHYWRAQEGTVAQFREVEICAASPNSGPIVQAQCLPRKKVPDTDTWSLIRFPASDLGTGDNVRFVTMRLYSDGRFLEEVLMLVKQEARDAPFFAEALKTLLSVFAGGVLSVATHFLFQTFESRRLKAEAFDRDRAGAIFVLKLINVRALEFMATGSQEVDRSQLLGAADVEKNVGVSNYVTFSGQFEEAIEAGLSYLQGERNQLELNDKIDGLIKEVRQSSQGKDQKIDTIF